MICNLICAEWADHLGKQIRNTKTERKLCNHHQAAYLVADANRVTIDTSWWLGNKRHIYHHTTLQWECGKSIQRRIAWGYKRIVSPSIEFYAGKSFHGLSHASILIYRLVCVFLWNSITFTKNLSQLCDFLVIEKMNVRSIGMNFRYNV